MNNVYTFKLNKVVSHNCDALRVEFDFKKDVGYIANVSLVGWNPGIIGFSLSTNVWIYPPIEVVIIPCKEQNTESSIKGLEIFKLNAINYAKEFIKTYNLSELNVKITASRIV